MIIPFLPLIAGTLSIALGLTVLWNGATRTAMRVPFAIFASSVGLWSLFISFFLLSTSAVSAQLFVVVYYIAALMISYSFMVFCLAYSSVRVSRSVIYLALVPWIAMSVMITSPGLFLGTIQTVPTHNVELLQPGYLLYAVIFVAYTLIGLSVLTVKALRSRRRTHDRHRRILAISLTISLLGGGFFNLLLPGLHVYDYIAWGPVFTFIMVTSVFYVIARHGLFDIRLAVVRTIAYTLSLFVLTSIYMVVAYGVFYRLLGQASTTEQLVLNMLLTVFLAFLFQPTKRFFDRLTNKLFYKDMYSSERFYGQLNKIMTSTVHLRQLLRQSAVLISNTLKSEKVAFFVYGERSVISVGTEKYAKIPAKDLHQLEALQKPTFVDDPSLPQGLRRLLIGYRVSVVVPLRRDDDSIGFLCLGEHRTSQYTRRDLKVLKTIAGELVIGIQNALSVQEVRDLNATLQQRIDAATKELRESNAQLQRLDEAKDEFISMASHQLRTPLTSIKGYISMLIEGDLGELTSQQKRTLEEAFVSSERMVRLVGDFLNVSRLQTGKFVVDKHPVDFARLVAREIEALEQNAKSRNLRFVYKRPKDIPLLDLDENKIQQVVMNFADNAMYYSKEGGTITVTLKKITGAIEFTVKDTGIGVPKAEQKGLFNKFFRATNARRQRPDGTGVGLFLAKKVIKDHGGQIIFESEEGKGSTFGFRLPLPKAKKV